MKRCYLGLANTFHDSAIAVVNDAGELVFAEATERHIQSKRAVNVMPDAFLRTGEILQEYCSDADEIVPAISWSEGYQRALPDQLRTLYDSREAITTGYGQIPEFLKRRFDTSAYVIRSQLRSMLHPGYGLEFECSRLQLKGVLQAVRKYDHHLTHAAAGCFSSPYEEAVCAVVDGFGEERAFACFSYVDGRLSEIELPAVDRFERDESDVSLGHFYEDVCDACGFGFMKGEEWKVMGLAPYGERDESLLSLMSQMIRVDGLAFEGDNTFGLMQARYRLHHLRRRPEQAPIEARNIAYAGQYVFTEVLAKFLNALYETKAAPNLVLGGGCALNSSANGQILERTAFDSLHVFCAPADDGNAVGAALLAYQQDHPQRRRVPCVQIPYLGSAMSTEALGHLRRFGSAKNLTECGDSAPERAAQLLAEGRIVGWIQGRAEFGPRALGNRSILADPRSAAIEEMINSRVKFREEFRPFAPSILDEFGAQYFENYQCSPYMERTLKFKPEVIARVPGAVHVDGTGRLQSVRREWNEKYYRLIRHFHDLTGVPLIINTSFNIMGKPIVHSVEDAVAVFYTSGLDAVFIEDLLITK